MVSPSKNVTFYSFREALAAINRNSPTGGLSFSDVPKLSKKDLVEYEACANFSEALLGLKGIISISFTNMIFDSNLVKFISKALSDYDRFQGMFFENIEFVSPENAVAIGEALKQRKPNENFCLSLTRGAASLFGPLMEASTVLGGKLEFKFLDVTFVDSTRYFRRWTLNASTVTSLKLFSISGLSDVSLVVLMKGLRNVSNLSHLSLNETKCPPGSLMILKESLSILFEKYQGSGFTLELDTISMNDAAVWKISELFLEQNKIGKVSLNNVNSSMAKRLISTRVIPNQNLYSATMMDVQFKDKTDFKLLYFALKTGRDCPFMYLSEDCFHQEDQLLIEQLPSGVGISAVFF